MYVSLWISWSCGTWFGLFCFTDSKLTWSPQMMTKIFWCVSQMWKGKSWMTKLSKLAAVDCWHCGQWGFVLSHMPRHGHQVLDISSCKCLFVCLRVLNHYYFYCFVASSYFPFYSVTSRITQARQKHAPETLHIFHPWKRTQGMMGKQHAQNRSALFPLYSA